MTFEEECIEVHNHMRKLHQAPPLKQKKELTQHAQMWANELARSGRFQHSKDSDYGENIAMTTKKEPTAEEMAKMWYDEIHKYNFNRPGFTSGTGHFTQLVWKDTTHVGVGIASGKYGTFVVANYAPAGNITNSGYFEKNVVPPTAAYKCLKKEKKRRTSSSSSSSSDDESSSKQGMSSPKEEKRINTKVKEFTDAKGRRVKETTTTTTTITTKGGSTSTSTVTDVKVEYLNSDPCSKSKPANHDGLLDGFDKLDVSDGKKSKKWSDEEIQKFRKECLLRHNELRALHGSPSLKEDKKLQEKAQKWAEHLLAIRSLQHSDDREMGENVAYKFASGQRIFSGEQITDMWYNEIKKYNFNNPGFTSGTGHFTQVVWRKSEKIGVGIATDGRGTLFAVANYFPAGNFMNQFKENVRPPKN